MYISNITIDYDSFTDTVNDYNFTNHENNIDVFIPTHLLTISCGLSFLCFLSLMIYTLIKPLFNNK